MNRRKLIAVLIWSLCLALLLAGCTVTAALLDRPKSFLWLVRSETNSVYILGSIHLARPDLYPLDHRIEAAFDRSEVLVVEADIRALDPDRVRQWVQAKGMYPENETLQQHLSPRIKAKMAELGIDPGSLGQTRPWLAALTLQAQKLTGLGFDERYGVDRHFLEKASQAKKKVMELESVDFQFRLLGRMTEAEQELFLYSTLVDMEVMDSSITEIVQAWRTGNTDRFAALLFKTYSEHPELRPLMEKLIFERNASMRAKIEKMLQNTRTYFVIVGSGHLVGRRGIIPELKAAGYQVEQQ